jgi:glycosyltransferase involved in cell wall biosynthesis
MHMAQLDISVALCTYNGARFLPEQLQSLAAQTRVPDELVVCDDRSTDETPRILEQFKQQVSFPVRLHFNDTNLGSTKNFEKAISLCRCQVIALSDQDDVWHPGKLSSTLEVFENRHNIGAVFSDAELIDQNSQRLAKNLWSGNSFGSREQNRFADRQELRVLLKHPVVTGATMAFRSGFRNLVLPIPSKQVHDCWIALLIASVSHLAAIRKALILYRKHDAQQIGPWMIDSLWPQIQLSSRGDRDYLGEAERFNEVYERLRDCSATFPPHPSALYLIQQKISHHKTRGSFPNCRLLRLPSLIRETATLRYWRYSNGLGSVARDLLV